MSISDYNTPQTIMEYMKKCTICPRQCAVDRVSGEIGYCGQNSDIRIARAALHYWEEPCISGQNGSGTVFFSGCNMRCVFCQNHEIAIGTCGQTISLERLTAIFLELQEKGAHNINLVTPTHYIPQIVYCLKRAKEMGLTLPIVYNTSGYETVSSLRLLEGLIDIYLPDLKYYSSTLSMRYSHAEDYFEVTCSALAEMFRQVGKPVLDEQTGLMKKGMIVRHLLLPGESKDSKKILRYLHTAYGNDIYVSIMNQYTPLSHVSSIPALSRRVTPEEYAKILVFADTVGIEQGFIQEGETALESFIPPFDFKGVDS